MATKVIFAARADSDLQISRRPRPKTITNIRRRDLTRGKLTNFRFQSLTFKRPNKKRAFSRLPIRITRRRIWSTNNPDNSMQIIIARTAAVIIYR